MTRRCIPAVLAFVMAVAAACGDDASSDTTTAGDDGVVVEGVDRDAHAGGAAGDSNGDSGGDGEPVFEIPDITDLDLADRPGFTFELTGDPCVDVETFVIVSNTEAFASMPDEDQQVAMLAAVEPFGDDAIAAVEAVIEADDPDLAVDDAELAEVYVGFDEITLEPCGWPLLGALFAVSEAAPIEFCSFDAPIDEIGGVQPAERCDADGLAPTSLPCFEESDGVLDSLMGVTLRWATVDCGSGQPVEWDGQIGAWVETTDAVAAPADVDLAPG